MFAAGVAVAQGLPDPTRPPAILDASQAAGAAGTAGATAPWVLQSIIRRAGARSAAVVSGSYVELGGKIGEATLVDVGEDKVELRSATGREILFLTPGVGKRVAPSETGAAQAARGKKEKVRP